MTYHIYKSRKGVVIAGNGTGKFIGQLPWDSFINSDGLYEKTGKLFSESQAIAQMDDSFHSQLLPPVGNQEIWAAGVTYYKSRTARMEESQVAGGSDFYHKVYEADRPELFFKSLGDKCVGPDDYLNIRKDSTWNVPEPELTLLINSKGKIAGYTIGNDMSSRSIEGENPLYLPQAKIYNRSASIGPCILVTNDPLHPGTRITIEISREGASVYRDDIAIDQIKRKFEDLVTYLFMENSFPNGCFLMTGTGLVPPNDFSLRKDDKVAITIDGIGTLTNYIG